MRKIGIISGYFNPVHYGHIQMINEASQNCDKLFVIVNNDWQQFKKKRKIIMSDMERALIVSRIHGVNDVTIAIDNDQSVSKSIEYIKRLTDDPYHEYIFFNGGDRKKAKDIPEAKICKELGIKMVFGCGGDKFNSSTEINERLGLE